MAMDLEQPDLVREALTAADTVDDTAITVESEGSAVVLRGRVATFEEASAATAIAEQHADAVRNELSVDPNLRERGDMTETPPTAAARDTTGSSFDPAAQPDDLVPDVQESLEENVAWDPPHEAVEVPTRAEERGVADRGAPEQGSSTDDAALEDPAGPATASLPELSPEELARAAHPPARDQESS